MANTSIEWTNAVWNPVRGCSKVSQGCKSCYAMRQAHRFSGPGQPYEGLTRNVPGKGPQWTGVVRCVPEMLERPLRWRSPRRIFVNSMSDLFHEQVPFDFIDQVFAVMALAPRHTFQILTKRPDRMRQYSESRAELLRIHPGYEHPVQKRIEETIDRRPTPEDAGLWGWPLPNVWCGTSVEDQDAADERIPHLLRAPASVRFLSCEPLLGHVDLKMDRTVLPALLHWVIIGGESGPGARPCDVEWIRSLVGQCQAADVPAFVKQLGASWYEQLALVRPESDRKGGDPSEWPKDLRVRDFPNLTQVTA